MFKLMPSDFDKGDYDFSGKRLVSHSVNYVLSEEEINEIFAQIDEYTTHQKRDYVLIFDDGSGNRVLAIDNLSCSERDELRVEGNFSKEEITTHDYYILVFDSGEI